MVPVALRSQRCRVDAENILPKNTDRGTLLEVNGKGRKTEKPKIWRYFRSTKILSNLLNTKGLCTNKSKGHRNKLMGKNGRKKELMAVTSLQCPRRKIVAILHCALVNLWLIALRDRKRMR